MKGGVKVQGWGRDGLGRLRGAGGCNGDGGKAYGEGKGGKGRGVSSVRKGESQ